VAYTASIRITIIDIANADPLGTMASNISGRNPVFYSRRFRKSDFEKSQKYQILTETNSDIKGKLHV
jgi:hypothetical protein